MITKEEFMELCQKYGLEDIYGDGEYFGIENIPLFTCDKTTYFGTNTKCFEYDKSGFYLAYELNETLCFRGTGAIEKLEKNIIACIKKYKKVKKEHRIKQVREL